VVKNDVSHGDGKMEMNELGLKRTLLAAVHELTSVHALSSDEELLVEAVLVGVLELNLSKGGTPARVVDDILDHTLDVALALGEIELTVLGGALPVEGVRLHSQRMDSTLIIDNLAAANHLQDEGTKEKQGIASGGRGDGRHTLKTLPLPFLWPLMTRPMVRDRRYERRRKREKGRNRLHPG
jgi:hypothetical protein